MKLLFSMLFVALFIISPDLSKVRVDYRNAVHNKENTIKLHKELAVVDKSDSKALVAYKGAVSTLMSKFAMTTSERKVFFKEGATLIEFAVSENPESIEIRCIRLGVQENAPKVVKYRKSKTEDKQFILDHYNEISSGKIKEYIKEFVMQSKSFSEEEKKMIASKD